MLLLMYNASSHPSEFKKKYSNIKIPFLIPANTSSKLLTAVGYPGIIQNFKVHYRQLLLRSDSCSTVFDVVKFVNILTAVRWVAQVSWEQVKTETTCSYLHW